MSAVADVAGETLTLFAERAAFWARRDSLLVADLHFGKAAAFRAGGIPVPAGTTVDGLDRLSTLVARTGASRVIFLGDFLHAREGRAPETLSKITQWRRQHAELELVLVRGNHDVRAGDPQAELGARCVDAPYCDPPFVFAHHPRESDAGYVLAGHLHPSVRLAGLAGHSVRLPCFWFGRRCGVLPAFGDFTGVATVEATNGDHVYVIADGKVISV
jgi:DNA ligase-associated metallophosphoesterase